jgi:peptide/nickel transport system permease protein
MLDGWNHFKRHRLGIIALGVLIAFIAIAIYAPFLASSKPLFVLYNGEPYFPLFRYLFYANYYSKPLDLFFNLAIFTVPIGLIACCWLKGSSHKRKLGALLAILSLHLLLFSYVALRHPQDPAGNSAMALARQRAFQQGELLSWQFELSTMTPYSQLNTLLHYLQSKEGHQRIVAHLADNGSLSPIFDDHPPTLWQNNRDNERRNLEVLQAAADGGDAAAKASIAYIQQRRQWLESESRQLKLIVWPLVRTYHWQDDAGGDERLNRHLPWWELTRVNHKDLVAALLFGTRISLVVGILAIAIALAIGIPIGAAAGFYGGTVDIVVCRLLEIWESMPTFFMLLMVVAILQSKSIFLVIVVIGLFGWTQFSRYIRGEFLKQRHLPYIEACYGLGLKQSRIIFSHILPNAMPPLLTLLPFAVMGAISSEAGLSFLGLGEEDSCSWGVLMDEGRQSFPGQSALLWPPAILLTVLLIAIALIGDALRDAIDPKLRQ